MSEMKLDINEIAMKVILYAGNGREKVDLALEKMEELNFEEAELLLAEAEKDITEAHIAQTKIIQSQVAGETYEYSLLFIHAQDTIMTINTELRMTKKLLPILKKISKEKI